MSMLSNLHRARCLVIAFLLWNGTHAIATAAETNVTALVSEARLAYQQGQAKESLILINKAIEANPKSPEARYFRGQLYVQSRQFQNAIQDFSEAVKQRPDFADAWEQRGEAQFRSGKVAGSIEDFDQFLKLEPAKKPYLWQLGLSYYYAGRYEDGKKLFELHQTVNRHDVENAVWHFLCAAKVIGLEKAREQLIPIEGDRRIPLMQIYALFRGKGTVDDVLKAAQAGDPGKAERQERQFYTHLYLALYYDATGNETAAREAIAKASGEFAEDGYMGDVARVHALFLRDKPGAKPSK